MIGRIKGKIGKRGAAEWIHIITCILLFVLLCLVALFMFWSVKVVDKALNKVSSFYGTDLNIRLFGTENINLATGELNTYNLCLSNLVEIGRRNKTVYAFPSGYLEEYSARSQLVSRERFGASTGYFYVVVAGDNSVANNKKGCQSCVQEDIMSTISPACFASYGRMLFFRNYQVKSIMSFGDNCAGLLYVSSLTQKEYEKYTQMEENAMNPTKGGRA